MLILLSSHITCSRHMYCFSSGVWLLSPSVSPYAVAPNFKVEITLNLRIYGTLTWFKERIRKEYMNHMQKIYWHTWTLFLQPWETYIFAKVYSTFHIASGCVVIYMQQERKMT